MRAIARDLPTEVQAAITADLESFVSAAHLPASLSDFAARSSILVRVERHRQRHVARMEAEAVARCRRDDRVRLIEAGKHRAWLETLSWDQESFAEARDLVADAPEDEVEHGLGEPRVCRLVEDLLDEFEEEQSDDEADDGGPLGSPIAV